eukprot:CAMPEP_0206491144 /NCGR_PEP_ID=MMETSP0324_2-20121206/44718_1 /ASSEMBLY_ACC=CAM_ASM_000836 /TAXON_ID=2866 /ORGANISM="Crypthecodinium cohnii, Strain Seligo" /LENGTH=90 /DNA_ID=CAMNT_0053972073 /DNA_START=114 /DNA_END=387 /DNA_ORIENTATION=-
MSQQGDSSGQWRKVQSANEEPLKTGDSHRQKESAHDAGEEIPCKRWIRRDLNTETEVCKLSSGEVEPFSAFGIWKMGALNKAFSGAGCPN